MRNDQIYMIDEFLGIDEYICKKKEKCADYPTYTAVIVVRNNNFIEKFAGQFTLKKNALDCHKLKN